MLVLAGEGAAVERPEGHGPHGVGFFDVRLNVTDEGRPFLYECRYYYPATSDGEDAEPDPSGAPYPTVIYHVYLPTLPYLPDPRFYNRTSDREAIELLVSHGMVVLTYTPWKPVILPERSLYNDLVWHNDRYNENASSPLHGMMITDSYGAMGECRGGSLSFLHACHTDRIWTVCSLGPWFGANASDGEQFLSMWEENVGSWMVQKGGEVTSNEPFTDAIYDSLGIEKLLMEVPDREERGPYRYDLAVAFFRYYLGGEEDMGSLLYGPEAFLEVLAGRYTLRYDIGDGEVVPREPGFTVSHRTTVLMDEEVAFNVICDANWLWDHPDLIHEWYLDDEVEPFVTSTGSPNVTFTFTGPATYGSVQYGYRVGDLSGRSWSGSLTVLNVRPEAGIERPGGDVRVRVDTRVDFSGWGRDTPSDNGTLRFSWDFGDGATAEGPGASHAYREPGTYRATLTVEDDHGAFQVVVRTVEVQDEPPLDTVEEITVVSGLVVVLGMLLVVTTETGKYWFGLLGGPLVMGRKAVLDHEIRSKLHAFISKRPGVHYSALRERFGLSNGEAAYHLNLMERERVVVSVRDGRLKRFYSTDTRVPESGFMSPERTREDIVDLVRSRPGINQLEVMEEMGLGRDAASYYLRELVKEGRLTVEREGRFKVYRAR